MRNTSALPRHRTGLLIMLLVLSLGFLGSITLSSPAKAEPFPEGYPKMGTEEEAHLGHRIVTPLGNYRTTLFPLYTQPGDSPDQLAYCVELAVSAQYEIDMSVGGWDSFPGDNNFAHDAATREHVAWIVSNSYPLVPLDELRATTGIDGLSEADAITGTQAAIWAYTDSAPASTGFVYSGLYRDGRPDTSSPEAIRVQQLVDYLTGEANTGEPETEGPHLSADPAAAAGTAGELVGPIRFESSAETVPASVDSSYRLVTADGEPVDLDAVPSGEPLYLDVPADAPAGTATVTASLSGPQRTGMLVSNTDPRTQTLMIARSSQARVTATAELSWTAVPTLSTTARDGDDGDEFLPESGPAEVIDVVEYTGLIPGQEYQLRGELMVRDGDEGTPTGITAERVFTPEQPAGSVELVFPVPDELHRGDVLVVFERLFHDGREVAAHADISDEGQTVYRPDIETDAYDLSDFDQLLPSTGGTLRDDVAYTGLKPGLRYIVRGEVIDHATGEPTGITAETAFAPHAPDGVVSVDFEVPSGYANRSLVVFERLYLAGTDARALDSSATDTLLATHTDPDDPRQTVVIEEEPPTTPPTTEPPTTPPVTEPPTTEPPTTPPATEPPVTSPATEPPTTEPPVAQTASPPPDQPDIENLPATGTAFPTTVVAIALSLLTAGMVLLVLSRNKRKNS